MTRGRETQPRGSPGHQHRAVPSIAYDGRQANSACRCEASRHFKDSLRCQQRVSADSGCWEYAISACQLTSQTRGIDRQRHERPRREDLPTVHLLTQRHEWSFRCWRERRLDAACTRRTGRGSVQRSEGQAKKRPTRAHGCRGTQLCYRSLTGLSAFAALLDMTNPAPGGPERCCPRLKPNQVHCTARRALKAPYRSCLLVKSMKGRGRPTPVKAGPCSRVQSSSTAFGSTRTLLMSIYSISNYFITEYERCVVG